MVAMQGNYFLGISDFFWSRRSYQTFGGGACVGIHMVAAPHSVVAVGKILHPAWLAFDRNDKVIPLPAALEPNRLIDTSQQHIFGRCGHWTQIEHHTQFCDLLSGFLARST